MIGNIFYIILKNGSEIIFFIIYNNKDLVGSLHLFFSKIRAFPFLTDSLIPVN